MGLDEGNVWEAFQAFRRVNYEAWGPLEKRAGGNYKDGSCMTWIDSFIEG
jgi:hypothetical protein